MPLIKALIIKPDRAASNGVKMRILAVGLIRFYQRTISPGAIPGLFSELSGCRFYPSCSEYAIMAIEKYGLWSGLKKSILRIIKCGPWTKGGINLP